MEKKREFTELPCILVLILAFLIQVARATDYTVGGFNGGWDTGTDLKAWTSKVKFYPGDTLTFTYQPFHDLLEVSEENFAKCSTEKYLAFYIGGMTIIDLTSPGTRYFICGVIGHCAAGMKLQVDILSPSSSPPPPSPPPPPPKSPSPPPAPPPKQNYTATPPPKRAPSYPPKLAPKHSPKSSPTKERVSVPVPAPTPAPVPVPAPSMSIAASNGINRIMTVIIIMGLVIQIVALI